MVVICIQSIIQTLHRLVKQCMVVIYNLSPEFFSGNSAWFRHSNTTWFSETTVVNLSPELFSGNCALFNFGYIKCGGISKVSKHKCFIKFYSN